MVVVKFNHSCSVQSSYLILCWCQLCHLDSIHSHHTNCWNSSCDFDLIFTIVWFFTSAAGASILCPVNFPSSLVMFTNLTRTNSRLINSSFLIHRWLKRHSAKSVLENGEQWNTEVLQRKSAGKGMQQCRWWKTCPLGAFLSRAERLKETVPQSEQTTRK